MKILPAILIAATLQLGSAEEQPVEEKPLPESAVLIVLKPEKSELAKGEEIDLEVFVMNTSSDSIQVPPSVTHDGYSSTAVDFLVRTFEIKDDQLESGSRSTSSSSLTDFSYRSLAPQKTKRYKFRWKCPDKDFDLLSLKVQFFIGGAFRCGQTTIILKNANKSEKATPRRLSD